VDRSAEKSGEPIDRGRILADRLLWAVSAVRGWVNS